jgi:glycosyltransferase involved in cell wall biosynthesis
MSGPQFSVIITCHNQSAFIRDAVDSAFAQGYASKEIIVVDDASSDGSPEILKQYGEKIRLAAFQTNQGANTARNLGAAMATGEYFIFLDGDDVLLPWALDVYGRIVDLRKPKIILSRMVWFDGALPAVKPEEVPREITFAEYEFLIKKNRQYQAGGSAIVIQSQTFHDVNGWTDDLFPLEDIDLMMKLGYSGLTIQILSPSTKRYRIHASNVRHRVPLMIGGLYTVIEKERSGVYSGGRRRRFDRYAILGAPVFFGIKSAYKAGIYKTAMTVFARGWPMFLAASARKINTMIRGRREPEILPLDSSIRPSG